MATRHPDSGNDKIAPKEPKISSAIENGIEMESGKRQWVQAVHPFPWSFMETQIAIKVTQIVRAVWMRIE
jgi:hypothetical protein